MTNFDGVLAIPSASQPLNFRLAERLSSIKNLVQITPFEPHDPQSPQPVHPLLAWASEASKCAG
jgi:hypothetical protein